jgi:archaemetzincin
MKIGVLAVGKVESKILASVTRSFGEIFPDTTCEVIGDVLALPGYAFDRKRGQYNSTMILNDVQSFAVHRMDLNRVLAMIDVDIYTSGLNFVFGEAYVAGKAGLISLWRLKPEFYGEAADSGAFELRTLKESVHELGHTLGLAHCPKSYCVMHFSNSIFEVDKKQSLFCDQCYLNASIAITKLGQQT